MMQSWWGSLREYGDIAYDESYGILNPKATKAIASRTASFEKYFGNIKARVDAMQIQKGRFLLVITRPARVLHVRRMCP